MRRRASKVLELLTPAYAARFTLTDHVVRWVHNDRADPATVRSDSIAAAVTLGSWFAAETRRVYAKVFESAAQRNAAALVDLIRRCGGKIGVRELMRTYSQRYPDAATAESALARLVELGLGRWMETCQKDLSA